VAVRSARSRAIERIGDVCYSSSADARSLRIAVLNEIRPVLAFDAYAWLLTDPESQVEAFIVAPENLPDMRDRPEVLRFLERGGTITAASG